MRKERTYKNPIAQNISDDLWAQWKSNHREGDAVIWSEKYGEYRQKYDKAINFGYVLESRTKTQITEFYAERLKEEIRQADELKKLNCTLEKTSTEALKTLRSLAKHSI